MFGQTFCKLALDFEQNLWQNEFVFKKVYVWKDNSVYTGFVDAC